MMRNSPYYCGCSLRVIILILLWFDLISQVLWVTRFTLIAVLLIPHLDTKVMYFESALLGWSCIIMVTTIHGIVGVEKKRPSYLVPYIGRHLLTLVVFTFCALGALGYLMLGDRINITVHGRKSHEYTRLTFNSMIYAMIVNLVLFWPLVFYFFYVLCNYSKVRKNDRLYLVL